MNSDRKQIKSLSNVNHPIHYGGKDNPCETIKVIESLGILSGFCIGNAIKYLMRAGKKDQHKTIEDLEKAIWYIDYFINDLKSKNDKEQVILEEDPANYYTQAEKDLHTWKDGVVYRKK
tara:strand:- start:85 stop:441 length:357 start_codon:yes stop_codon:yes gene_type:complete